MNVLSLFDGMSCGQQALDRLGVKVDNYFASEIDKYAIQVTMANYPNTKQLGSVVNVDGNSLPKIDLLLGGSPCQSFSFAGKRKGMATKCETEILTLEHYLELKAEGYEFEGQSYLFWEYMRLLNECKPTYFLLENVEMGEKWEKVLSKAIGVNGIHINSALVSAQNRKRIYWTNIGMQPSGLFGDLESIIEQPKDRGILLKDVLQDNPNAKYYISSKMEEHLNSRDFVKIKNGEDKSGTITTNGEGKQGNNSTFISQEVDEKYFLSEKMFDWLTRHSEKRGNEFKKTKGDRKAGCLSVSALQNVNLSADFIIKNLNDEDKNYNLLKKQHEVKIKQVKQINPSLESGGNQPYQQNRVYDIDGISGNTNAVEIVAQRGRGEKGNIEQQLEARKDGKTNCLTSVQKDNLIRQLNPSIESGGKQPYQQDRIYDIDGISPALCANKSDLLITSGTLRTHKDGEGFREVQSGKGATIPARAREDGSGQNVVAINSRIRRLTPIECERLQTVADNYTNHVSDSQRYKMLGNGWTIDVIAHILKYAKF
jgi:DNA (cytosine-5)-methyltransferase 3A